MASGKRKFQGSWVAAGKEWVKWDPCRETCDQIDALVSAEDDAGLEAKLAHRMAFGTSGLRAAMGPGVGCINPLTIIQTAQGLATYLHQQFSAEQLRTRGIAIGYDHRQFGDNKEMSSAHFAELTACIMANKGVRCYLYRGFVATPLVPYCIKSKKCVAGVMVTASHNPKEDNGYKVYWENGSQIVPPHDSGIAAAIAASLEPWTSYQTAEVASAVSSSELVEDPTAEMREAYFQEMGETLCRHHVDNQESPIKVVYTPMHGVGDAWTSRAFEVFGLNPYFPTPEQIKPDAQFPTVAFPNPEEGKGALELSLKAARACGASLLVANDPDADRLAVCEIALGNGDGNENGKVRMFTGNEIGVLLGHWQWRKHCEAKAKAGAGAEAEAKARGKEEQLAVVASTVSSKMLRAVAHAEGFQFHEVLTGFKWIGSRCGELQAQGVTTLFSYEESIGFCVGQLVNDKDGVAAAAVFVEMAEQLRREGLSVGQHMDRLYEKYGIFCCNNKYFKCYDPAVTNRMFDRLRRGGEYWQSVGEGGKYAITHIRDLGITSHHPKGYDSSQADKLPILPVNDPKSGQMITYSFANGCVATLRTSGTEPKLKYYIELPGPPGVPYSADAHAKVQAEVDAMAACIIAEMLQPELNELESPPAE